MAEEVDVIRHLLDVEHDASELLLEAQKEADRRTAEARTKVDVKFKEQYKKFTSELDLQEENAKQIINVSHEETMSQYKKTLESMPIDTVSFDKLLTEILFN